MEIQSNVALLPTAPGDTAQDSESASAEARVTAASDFETFLTLLTAQLRNQDPLQPIDSAEFVAQLASFSTVEQLIGTNERLDTLAEAGATGDVAALSSWIGQSVADIDGRFRADGEAVSFSYQLPADSTRAEALITDAAGTVLSRFDIAPDASEAVWDGTIGGVQAGVGETLRLLVAGYDAEGLIEERSARIFREVVALRGSPDGAVLELADGSSIAPEDVAELRAIETEDD
ncbi:MAG: flagellar hook capping FlgD N-terminal domain-containing protein [Pseudomonadota bacterium]